MVDVSVVNFQPTDKQQKVLYVGTSDEFEKFLGIPKENVIVSAHSGLLTAFRFYMTSAFIPFDYKSVKSQIADVMLSHMAACFVTEAQNTGASHIVVDSDDLKEMEGWNLAIKSLQTKMKIALFPNWRYLPEFGRYLPKGSLN